MHDIVLGLHGQVWVAVEGTRLTSARSCQRLPQCPSEPIPDGSKTDVLLAKVEPIRNAAKTTVVMYLRRRKKK